jgi:hypothetical protein
LDVHTYFSSDFPIKIKVSKPHDIKEGVEVILHALLMLELSEVECLVHIPAIILPKKIILVKATCTPQSENYVKEKIIPS